MKPRTNILITGANGFVGNALLSAVLQREIVPVAVARQPVNMPVEAVIISELNGDTDWLSAFAGRELNVVIHVAARVHMMNDNSADPLVAFCEVNTQGTLNLARYAAKAGTKRFIFISSIKVNGESTLTDKPFRYDDPLNVKDPYAISKAEAEAGLRQIAKETGMEVVVIRPPLIYGPGVKANFAMMMRLAQKNLPLPLGAIHNKRSLVALDNLIDLIMTCIDHPNAANQTFLVSDDQDISTTELLKLMTITAGKSPRLLPVPVSWLKLVGTLTGKHAVIDRLCGNLQVDISHTKETLNWVPPLTLENGIKRCF